MIPWRRLETLSLDELKAAEQWAINRGAEPPFILAKALRWERRLNAVRREIEYRSPSVGAGQNNTDGARLAVADQAGDGAAASRADLDNQQGEVAGSNPAFAREGEVAQSGSAPPQQVAPDNP